MAKKKKEWGIKYGCPIYGIAWPPGEYVYMCGGGGHGIENKVTVLRCRDGLQSEEVAKLNTGADAGYRLIMHPSGRSLERTKAIGPLKGMSFSSDGRLLALGGEDGAVELWEWPQMQRKLRWQASAKAVRNVDFSGAHSDGVLFTCDEAGACRLWDAATGDEIAQLEVPPEMPRASFFRCKSTVDDEGIVLLTPMKWKRDAWMVKWRQDPDGGIHLDSRSRKPVAPAPICGFELSRSGELMAAVTPDGDQLVMDCETLKVIKHVKAAHMTFATSVAFSPDEQFIISGSSDASAVLTRIARPPGAGAGIAGLLVGLLAVVVALLAVLAGVLHHLARTRPDDVRELLAPLAPLLRHAVEAQWLPPPIQTQSVQVHAASRCLEEDSTDATDAAGELALAVFAAAGPPQLTILGHLERDDKMSFGSSCAGLRLASQAWFSEVTVELQPGKIDVASLDAWLGRHQACLHIIGDMDYVFCDAASTVEWAGSLVALPSSLLTSLVVHSMYGLPAAVSSLTALTRLEWLGTDVGEYIDENAVEDYHLLGSVSANHLRSLTRLRQLSLDGTDLGSSVEELLSLPALVGLQSLSLCSCNLERVPPMLSALAQLTSVDLSYNRDAANGAHLQSLCLGHCRLTVVPEQLAGITNLTHLDLSDNKRLLGGWQHLLPLIQLRRLSLARCNLQVLPGQLAALTVLSSLDLTKNWQMERGWQHLLSLTQLQSLELCCCDFIAVPEQLPALTALTYLTGHKHQREADELNLTGVPEQLSALTALTRLHLYNDKQLADGWRHLLHLTQLQDLDLVVCSLAAVPGPLSALTALTRLCLLTKGNALLRGWEPLRQLTCLCSLRIVGSRSTAVPEQLSALTALTHLELSGNSQLVSGWQHLIPLTQLQDLDVSGCRFAAVPEQMSALTALTRLDMGFNTLESGWQHLQLLPRLKKLHLKCAGKQVPLPPPLNAACPSHVVVQCAQCHRNLEVTMRDPSHSLPQQQPVPAPQPPAPMHPRMTELPPPQPQLHSEQPNALPVLGAPGDAPTAAVSLARTRSSRAAATPSTVQAPARKRSKAALQEPALLGGSAPACISLLEQLRIRQARLQAEGELVTQEPATVGNGAQVERMHKELQLVSQHAQVQDTQAAVRFEQQQQAAIPQQRGGAAGSAGVPQASSTGNSTLLQLQLLQQRQPDAFGAAAALPQLAIEPLSMQPMPALPSLTQAPALLCALGQAGMAAGQRPYMPQQQHLSALQEPAARHTPASLAVTAPGQAQPHQLTALSDGPAYGTDPFLDMLQDIDFTALDAAEALEPYALPCHPLLLPPQLQPTPQQVPPEQLPQRQLQPKTQPQPLLQSQPQAQIQSQLQCQTLLPQTQAIAAPGNRGSPPAGSQSQLGAVAEATAGPHDASGSAAVCQLNSQPITAPAAPRTAMDAAPVAPAVARASEPDSFAAQQPKQQRQRSGGKREADTASTTATAPARAPAAAAKRPWREVLAERRQCKKGPSSTADSAPAAPKRRSSGRAGSAAAVGRACTHSSACASAPPMTADLAAASDAPVAALETAAEVKAGSGAGSLLQQQHQMRRQLLPRGSERRGHELNRPLPSALSTHRWRVRCLRSSSSASGLAAEAFALETGLHEHPAAFGNS
ncbi:SEC12-like protein 2 [Chlorella vulgaris]